MKETVGTSLRSHISLRKDQDEFGQASILNTPIQLLDGDKMKIGDKISKKHLKYIKYYLQQDTMVWDWRTLVTS